MSKKINQASKSAAPLRQPAAKAIGRHPSPAVDLHTGRGVSTEERAAQMLGGQSALAPALAIILGSGFQSVCEAFDVEQEFPFGNIPGFRTPTVGGHAGKVILGRLEGIPVWLLSGRLHYYEGYSMAEITFGVRLLARLGVQDLVLTNAAGGINRKYRPGDFMILRDHINMMGSNPLRGEGTDGTRFVDLSAVYDSRLADMALRAGRKARARLHRGVYLAVAGPCYETPAEIGAFARLGADAVGMSTVPEAIAARQLKLRVLGISSITNAAAGLSAKGLSHDDVLARGAASKETAADLLRCFARSYGQAE